MRDHPITHHRPVPYPLFSVIGTLVPPPAKAPTRVLPRICYITLQAVVFCLVDMYLILGEQLTPHLEALSTSQLKLVTIYINKTTKASVAAIPRAAALRRNAPRPFSRASTWQARADHLHQHDAVAS